MKKTTPVPPQARLVATMRGLRWIAASRLGIRAKLDLARILPCPTGCIAHGPPRPATLRPQASLPDGRRIARRIACRPQSLPPDSTASTACGNTATGAGNGARRRTWPVRYGIYATGQARLFETNPRHRPAPRRVNRRDTTDTKHISEEATVYYTARFRPRATAAAEIEDSKSTQDDLDESHDVWEYDLADTSDMIRDVTFACPLKRTRGRDLITTEHWQTAIAAHPALLAHLAWSMIARLANYRQAEGDERRPMPMPRTPGEAGRALRRAQP